MSEEEVLPHAVVTDQDDGVVVTIRRDPRITAVPSAGVVLLGDELARHGELELCGGFLQTPAHGAAATPRPSWASWPRASCPSCPAAWRSRCAPAACRASRAASPPRVVARAAPGRLVAVGPARAGLRPSALRAHRRRPPRPPGRPGAGARRAGRAPPGREAARRARSGLRPAQHLRGRGHRPLRRQAQALARRAVPATAPAWSAPACASSPSCASRVGGDERAGGPAQVRFDLDFTVRADDGRHGGWAA